MGDMTHSAQYLSILIIIPILLKLLVSLIMEVVCLDELRWTRKPLGTPPHPMACSLNYGFAYFLLDGLVSVATCISILHLTEVSSIGFSPLVSVARWGGIVCVFVFYTSQIPIKGATYCVCSMVAKSKILCNLILEPEEFRTWVEEKDSAYRVVAPRDFLKPWLEIMSETVFWIGLYICGGVVGFFLIIKLISWIVESLINELNLSPLGKEILDRLLLMSDWFGAIFWIFLMLKMTVDAFSTTAIYPEIVCPDEEGA